MRRDDVIRMAREAGIAIPVHHGKVALPVSVWRFAEMLLAAEREACARVIDGNIAVSTPGSMLHDILMSNADAIRARGIE